MQDAFGHEQLGGVAPIIARLIKHKLGYKYHYAIADYLQRSARHIASQTDLDHACAIGEAAIDAIIKGENNIMLTIDRQPGAEYSWKIGSVPLANVANVENKIPRNYIDEEGYGISEEGRRYLEPLIQGEEYPHY